MFQSQYQVVAVYPSGRRYPVRKPHDSLERAQWHVEWCERDADPRDTWRYEIDVRYVGSDGQIHWRGNVDTPVTSCKV
jgi:hypothetical protein